jgi:prepilin-type N-terminal cleavage/methylation domain-containing protein
MPTTRHPRGQDAGFTLIELLVTVAVIALVFAIAVPVALNITAGVSSDSNSVATQAKASFDDQNFGALGASSSSDSTYTYAVFNGRTIAKILKYAVRTNLIPNPSFETNTTGWINGYNSTFTQTTSTANTGTNSVAMTSSLAGGMGIRTNTTAIPVTGNTAYTLSAYVKSATISRTAQLYVYSYDSTGTLVGSQSVSTATSTSGWTRLSVGVTTAANTAYLQPRLEINTTTAGETHYWDSVLLEPSNTLGNYFDGSTGSTLWTATPHASSSKQYS